MKLTSIIFCMNLRKGVKIYWIFSSIHYFHNLSLSKKLFCSHIFFLFCFVVSVKVDFFHLVLYCLSMWACIYNLWPRLTFELTVDIIHLCVTSLYCEALFYLNFSQIGVYMCHSFREWVSVREKRSSVGKQAKSHIG